MSAINLPNLPPIRTKPLKANTVVIVAVKTGNPIKIAAPLAAAMLKKPKCHYLASSDRYALLVMVL